AASAGGPGEGIKVHGHWTITVANQDGTVAETRDFENALNPSNPLASFVARRSAVGTWAIRFGAGDPAQVSGANSPCQQLTVGGAFVPASCALVEPDSGRPG